MPDKNEIRHKIFELIAENSRDVAKRLADEFGLSRQTANTHLNALVRDNLIKAEGNTKARIYSLAKTHDHNKLYKCDGLQEDIVWREMVSPIVNDLHENVKDIWRYSVTEMVNNAIDHSGAPTVFIRATRNALYTECWVMDKGEGIFNKIQRELDLYDPREAILELAKGKLTTDPANHTGEGIFFTSRAVDRFEIYSGRLCFMHSIRMEDWLMESHSNSEGTNVFMLLLNNSTRILTDIFNEYASPENFTFSKTIVPVRLAQYEGEKLVSRSQAKRLYQRFEKFSRVVLDFEGVAEIGQAFADELFRVFPSEHPKVELVPIHTTKLVSQMIDRARARKDMEGTA